MTTNDAANYLAAKQLLESELRRVDADYQFLRDTYAQQTHSKSARESIEEQMKAITGENGTKSKIMKNLDKINKEISEWAQA